MDWDILRIVIAVADAGSAVAAAEKLGVNASTVLRRIAKFEEEFGVRLFERRQSGYTPTVECAAVVEAARQIEQSVADINRNILGRDLRLEGKVTVTTTDTLLHAVLAPHIATFKARHPKIHIEVTVTNTRLNLTRHDADVAIRASRNPPENLIGQRISSVAFAVYGPRAISEALPAEPGLNDLMDKPWIGIGDALANAPIGGWLSENVPPDRLAMTADTFLAIRDCAAAGGGLAVLPCFLGDRSKQLMQILPPDPAMETTLWILTHADFRGTARIKAFIDHVVPMLRSNRAMLEGRGD